MIGITKAKNTSPEAKAPAVMGTDNTFRDLAKLTRTSRK
jgi:hypothetical protein